MLSPQALSLQATLPLHLFQFHLHFGALKWASTFLSYLWVKSKLFFQPTYLHLYSMPISSEIAAVDFPFPALLILHSDDLGSNPRITLAGLLSGPSKSLNRSPCPSTP